MRFCDPANDLQGYSASKSGVAMPEHLGVTVGHTTWCNETTTELGSLAVKVGLSLSLDLVPELQGKLKFTGMKARGKADLTDGSAGWELAKWCPAISTSRVESELLQCELKDLLENVPAILPCKVGR